jgi:hypothetical protein
LEKITKKNPYKEGFFCGKKYMIENRDSRQIAIKTDLLVKPDITVDRETAATFYLAKEVSLRQGPVIAEGPPTYLWGQDFHDPNFVNGWNFVTRLQDHPTFQNMEYACLVDDISNRPDGIDTQGMIDRVRELKKSSVTVARSPIFQPPALTDTHIVRFWQSEFQTRGEQCHVADANFQAEKFKRIQELPIGERGIRSSLLVVVHPTDFVEQQTAMLNYLQQKALVPYIKDNVQRQRAIQQTYRHVWYGGKGKLLSVTKPKWDGSKFAGFEDLAFMEERYHDNPCKPKKKKKL